MPSAHVSDHTPLWEPVDHHDGLRLHSSTEEDDDEVDDYDGLRRTRSVYP